MLSCGALRVLTLAVVVLLVATQVTSAAPYTDYDNLRDLYELLLRNEGVPPPMARFAPHQMERKGGRSPSLRLRFGRRADPLFNPTSSEAGNNEGSVN